MKRFEFHFKKLYYRVPNGQFGVAANSLVTLSRDRWSTKYNPVNMTTYPVYIYNLTVDLYFLMLRFRWTSV